MGWRRRWRRPRVVWFYGSRPKPVRTRPPRVSRHWHRPRRIPWPSVGLYGITLILATLALWRTSPRPWVVVPVTGNLLGQGHKSWLARSLESLHVSRASTRSWLNQGIPILGLTTESQPFQWRWRSWVLTGLTDLSGVRLTSLNALLQLEIPALRLVPTPKAIATTPPPKPLPSYSGQNATMAGLPGVGSRIWAELGSKPLVGIYQTHSSESFWPAIPSGSPTANSSNWSKTIVQVGWWLANDLHQRGIGVVQSRVNNMSDGLLASYNKSYYTAKQLIKWYPSVRVLIDLHRAQASQAATTTTIHGIKSAQILIVVGTNKVLPNPYWHQNLTFAMRLAKALDGVAPGILRGNGIDMVPYRYNQQLMPADVLIEIGGVDNTLQEERVAAAELAKALAIVAPSGGGAP